MSSTEEPHQPQQLPTGNNSDSTTGTSLPSGNPPPPTGTGTGLDFDFSAWGTGNNDPSSSGDAPGVASPAAGDFASLFGGPSALEGASPEGFAGFFDVPSNTSDPTGATSNGGADSGFTPGEWNFDPSSFASPGLETNAPSDTNTDWLNTLMASDNNAAAVAHQLSAPSSTGPPQQLPYAVAEDGGDSSTVPGLTKPTSNTSDSHSTDSDSQTTPQARSQTQEPVGPPEGSTAGVAVQQQQPAQPPAGAPSAQHLDGHSPAPVPALGVRPVTSGYATPERPTGRLPQQNEPLTKGFQLDTPSASSPSSLSHSLLGTPGAPSSAPVAMPLVKKTAIPITTTTSTNNNTPAAVPMLTPAAAPPSRLFNKVELGHVLKVFHEQCHKTSQEMNDPSPASCGAATTTSPSTGTKCTTGSDSSSEFTTKNIHECSAATRRGKEHTRESIDTAATLAKEVTETLTLLGPQAPLGELVHRPQLPMVHLLPLLTVEFKGLLGSVEGLLAELE